MENKSKKFFFVMIITWSEHLDGTLSESRCRQKLTYNVLSMANKSKKFFFVMIIT